MMEKKPFLTPFRSGKDDPSPIKFCHLPLLGFHPPSLLRGYKDISISPVNEGILKQKISAVLGRQVLKIFP